LNPDIQWALDAISARSADYDLARAYYDGQHRLDFVPSEFRHEFAALLRRARLNMCPAVVTSVRDRLKLTGLTHNGEVKKETEEGRERIVSDPVGERLNALWRRNRMEQRAGEIHLESLTVGDAYAIVWPSARTGEVTIYPNFAHMVAVQYDDEEPDMIVKAARKWAEPDKRVALNLYYPDRIEKYLTVNPLAQGGQLKAKMFAPVAGEEVVFNPYDQVPVFHFGNGAGCGRLGTSELKEAIPVQDALNKTLRDMLIGGEEQAFKQRYATGVELPTDPETGQKINPFVANEFWATAAKDATFGELEAANLEQLQTVKDGYKMDMAMVTGLPPHHFFAGGGTPPSGESLKTLEQRLTSKVEDRQTAFGATWESLFKFALRLDSEVEDVELDALWRDTTPRNEQEQQGMVLERVEKLGVPPEQGLKELGYTGEEVAKFAEWKRTQGVQPGGAQ